jgi:DNA-binding NarL/FixJ family response regulator
MTVGVAPAITVLIVDDQPLQRAGYRMVLESTRGIEVIGEAGDGAQALAFTRRTATDVVLMDIRMPRVNGFVATERIRSDEQVRELGPAPRVVLLTALDLDDHISTAAGSGAYAVLYKDVAPEALIEAIRGAARHRGD